MLIDGFNVIQYRFTRLVQRIFNSDKIQDYNHTPDNVMNILIYESPLCVIKDASFENGPVFWSTRYTAHRVEILVLSYLLVIAPARADLHFTERSERRIA